MPERPLNIQAFPILSETMATLNVWSQALRHLSDWTQRDAELFTWGTWDPEYSAGGGSITSAVTGLALWVKRFPFCWFTVSAAYEIPANRSRLQFTLPFRAASWLITALGDSQIIPAGGFCINSGGTRETGPVLIIPQQSAVWVYRDSSAAFTTGADRSIFVTGLYMYDE